MGENSKIEWTHHTFNPWIGCTKVAPGCTHCYAETFAKRTGKAKWGPEGTRVKTSEKYWQQPLKWNREAEAAGERRRVFCASMADVFEDWHGPVECGAYGAAIGLKFIRDDLFALIDCTPNLDWLLLTKRPENVRRMWPPPIGGLPEFGPELWRNVWLGTSIGDQATAEDYWYRLQEAGGLPRFFFLSIEPLTGPIDPHRAFRNGPLPDWVIVGGESGHHARPMHPQWVRTLRDYFVAAGIPFFFKQWGEWIGGCQQVAKDWPKRHSEMEAAGNVYVWPKAMPSGPPHFGMNFSLRIGKKAAGRLLDGREWNEFPHQRPPASIG